jgi:hypothetical protein
VLAAAELAYAGTDDTASALISAGYRPEPVGAELEPPKQVFVVPRAKAEELTRITPVPVRLGPELLAAPCWVLVRFQDETDDR